MTKFFRNEDFWLFSQSWNRRNTSSIIPKQDKKRSTSDMNELGDTTFDEEKR